MGTRCTSWMGSQSCNRQCSFYIHPRKCHRVLGTHPGACAMRQIQSGDEMRYDECAINGQRGIPAHRNRGLPGCVARNSMCFVQDENQTYNTYSDKNHRDSTQTGENLYKNKWCCVVDQKSRVGGVRIELAAASFEFGRSPSRPGSRASCILRLVLRDRPQINGDAVMR